MASATYPRSAQWFAHSLKARPPPPCTSSTAGDLSAAMVVEGFAGRPRYAKTRVGVPASGSPSYQTSCTRPSVAPNACAGAVAIEASTFQIGGRGASLRAVGADDYQANMWRFFTGIEGEPETPGIDVGSECSIARMIIG